VELLLLQRRKLLFLVIHQAHSSRLSKKWEHVVVLASKVFSLEIAKHQQLLVISNAQELKGADNGNRN
jgi:hypothetical protein